jgi:glycine oxidase
MWVGHRPGSRDDAPILGPSPITGLVYATGHHRNGILLAPITAACVASLVADTPMPAEIARWGVERFIGGANPRS